MEDHIHYYQLLLLQNNGTMEEAIHPANEYNVYLFVKLQSDTEYHFKVNKQYSKQWVFITIIYIKSFVLKYGYYIKTIFYVYKFLLNMAI